MVSYNQGEKFDNQFFENYDDLFDKVASSFSVAVSDPSVTNEQREQIIKTNIQTIITMCSVYRKEEELFNLG